MNKEKDNINRRPDLMHEKKEESFVHFEHNENFIHDDIAVDDINKSSAFENCPTAVKQAETLSALKHSIILGDAINNPRFKKPFRR